MEDTGNIMDAFNTDVSRGIEAVPITKDDDDKSDASDFVYVRCNIPGPSISRGKFQEQFEGCSGCLPDSSCDAECVCITRSGRNYDDQGSLLEFNPYSDEMKPVYECNKECRCASSCYNRVVQHGIQISLEVFLTDSKGLGLRSKEDIPHHQFVCEYAGEILCPATAKKRIANLGPSDSNYILVVKEHLHSGDLISTIVDPTFIGNAGRFINHSCEPNLYMLPVRVNNSIPHLALFALRPISAGEELTFDYSGNIQKPEDEECKAEEEDQERRESVTPVTAISIQPYASAGKVEIPRKPCHCGSEVCRGFLPFDESLFAENIEDK